MNVISKKELLSRTGISYGQLYRWKREGLIPEEWFVKQSSYTGQETFFPREEILARIEAILELKDGHSLEELASMLAPEAGRLVAISRLMEIEGFPGPALDALVAAFPSGEATISAAALARGIVRLAGPAGLDASGCARLIGDSIPGLGTLKTGEIVCTLFSSGGVHACFSEGTARPAFDAGVTVYGVLPLGEETNALKTLVEGD